MKYQISKKFSLKWTWKGILVCFFFFSGNTQSANVNWYKIELIVFKQHLSTLEKFGPSVDKVDWPEDLVHLDPLDMRLGSDVSPYATISAADSELAYLYNKLGKSPDYTALLRIAWMQPVGKNRSGKAVQISGNGISGYARLQRGTYLHLVVDLSYSKAVGASGDSDFEPIGEPSHEDNPESVFHIYERRRILLKETHYFDHPKLGVITKVSLL